MQAAKDACEEAISGCGKIVGNVSFGDFLSENGVEEFFEWDVEYVNVCRAIVDAYDGK